MLVWMREGPPWGREVGGPGARRTAPSKDETARNLVPCGALDFRLVVSFSRLTFTVKLEAGRVTELTPLVSELS